MSCAIAAIPGVDAPKYTEQEAFVLALAGAPAALRAEQDRQPLNKAACLLAEPDADDNSPIAEAHPDDLVIDRFASAMKAKMTACREKGRGGWETVPVDQLRGMLVDHIFKGDPVDVGNFCAMLFSLGALYGGGSKQSVQ